MLLKFVQSVAAVSLCIALSACGGRVAQPVGTVTNLDTRLSCSHLSGEYNNHDKRLVELVGEERNRGRDNLGILLASPLFLDLSTTLKDEVEAINLRQDKLIELMKVKGCAVPQVADDISSLDVKTEG